MDIGGGKAVDRAQGIAVDRVLIAGRCPPGANSSLAPLGGGLTSDLLGVSIPGGSGSS